MELAIQALCEFPQYIQCEYIEQEMIYCDMQEGACQQSVELPGNDVEVAQCESVRQQIGVRKPDCCEVEQEDDQIDADQKICHLCKLDYIFLKRMLTYEESLLIIIIFCFLVLHIDSEARVPDELSHIRYTSVYNLEAVRFPLSAGTAFSHMNAVDCADIESGLI